MGALHKAVLALRKYTSLGSSGSMYALVLQNQTVGAISIFGCITCMYALAVKVKQWEQSSLTVSLHVLIAVHTTRQAAECFYEYQIIHQFQGAVSVCNNVSAFHNAVILFRDCTSLGSSGSMYTLLFNTCIFA